MIIMTSAIDYMVKFKIVFTILFNLEIIFKKLPGVDTVMKRDIV